MVGVSILLKEYLVGESSLLVLRSARYPLFLILSYFLLLPSFLLFILSLSIFFVISVTLFFSAIFSILCKIALKSSLISLALLLFSFVLTPIVIQTRLSSVLFCSESVSFPVSLLLLLSFLSPFLLLDFFFQLQKFGCWTDPPPSLKPCNSIQ